MGVGNVFCACRARICEFCGHCPRCRRDGLADGAGTKFVYERYDGCVMRWLCLCGPCYDRDLLVADAKENGHVLCDAAGKVWKEFR